MTGRGGETAESKHRLLSRLYDVEGYVAIVTGGASGIGLAIADILSALGAHVTILDINPQRVKEVVADLSRQGRSVSGAVVDVSDRHELARNIEEVAERHGRLDVMFANAAINSPPGFLTLEGTRSEAGALENVTDEHWDKIFATNVSSVLTTLRSAVKVMKRQLDGGRIVVTSSVAAFRTEPIEGTPYMPSKSAVVALVNQVALEVAKFNIHINTIVPGPIATNIGNGFLKDVEKRKWFERKIPLGRVGQPEELQSIALLLASRNASSFITGSHFVVDGGIMLGAAD